MDYNKLFEPILVWVKRQLEKDDVEAVVVVDALNSILSGFIGYEGGWLVSDLNVTHRNEPYRYPFALFDLSYTATLAFRSCATDEIKSMTVSNAVELYVSMSYDGGDVNTATVNSVATTVDVNTGLSNLVEYFCARVHNVETEPYNETVVRGQKETDLINAISTWLVKHETKGIGAPLKMLVGKRCNLGKIKSVYSTTKVFEVESQNAIKHVVSIDVLMNDGTTVVVSFNAFALLGMFNQYLVKLNLSTNVSKDLHIIEDVFDTLASIEC